MRRLRARPRRRLCAPASLCAVMLLFLIPDAVAQQSDALDYIELSERADAAFRGGRWEEAESLYRALADANPANGEIWTRLARIGERLEKTSDAVAAHEKTIELGFGRVPVTALRIAQLYTADGDVDAALEWIEWALDHGLEGRERIQQDRRFAVYEHDPRFRALAGYLPERELDRVEGWRYDLDYLVTEIRRLHAAFERPSFAPGFEAAVETLRDRIPELSAEQIALQMQRLMASLGDGHSGVWPVGTERVRFTGFPIDLYLFSDGLFVVGGDGEASARVGSRVIAVGGRPLEDLLSEIEPYVSRDNPMGVLAAAPSLLTRPVVLDQLGALLDPERVTYTLEDRNGNRSELTLTAGEYRRRWRIAAPAAGADPLPLYLRNRDRNIWLQELPEHEAVYVQYNAVRNVASNTIADFADTLLATLDRTGATSVIVDARLNGGGNNFLNWPLVRSLIRYQSSAPERQIYVLAGRHTFSAAQNFSNWVERLTDAVFVGEPTGSRPNFTGETTPITLPYSGLRASISSRYWQDSHATDRRRWLAPSVPATLSSEAYFENRDPALEAVLELLRRKRTSA